MPDWQFRMQIKDLLEPEPSPNNAITAASGIADRLERNVPPRLQDDELDDIIADFRTICRRDNPVESLTFMLAELYDWADSGHRLWFDPT